MHLFRLYEYVALLQLIKEVRSSLKVESSTAQLLEINSCWVVKSSVS